MLFLINQNDTYNYYYDTLDQNEISNVLRIGCSSLEAVQTAHLCGVVEDTPGSHRRLVSAPMLHEEVASRRAASSHMEVSAGG